MKKLTSKEAKPAAAKSVAAAVPVAPKAASAAAKSAPAVKTEAQAKAAGTAPKEKKAKAPAKVTEKPAVAAAPAVKAPAAKPVKAPAVKAPALNGTPTTTLIAQLDVGFGNVLYVRGEGAGLSWDKGLVMENLSADQWKLVLPGATTPVVFKFLVNDERWSVGDDYVAVPGSTSTLVPLF